MSRSRRCRLYCDPVDWADITDRARTAGMNTSAFVVACALQDDPPDPPADTVLALTAEEQRTLHDRIELLDRCSWALHEPLPELGMSMFGALAFLCRIHGDGEDPE
ncbi:MAG: hypothetical protein OXI81_17835 [Paracoccaceae bacterium]|nr:hypothetical protein [Paracoccaceae bacterium]